MVLIRSNLSDLFGTTALPAIHHIVYEQYKSYSDFVPILFNYESSDRDIEQTSQLSGFDIATTIQEGESVTYQDLIQGYDRTYTHTKYGKGYKVSDQVVTDGKFMTLKRISMALPKSVFEVRQSVSANVFNDAFTTSTDNPNSESLCSTTHALIRGGTNSNRLAADADLSLTSLREALRLLLDTRDGGNLRLNFKAKYLITSNGGADNSFFTAWELLKSNDRPDTANRATNAFNMFGMEPLICNYFTDLDQWFVAADKNEHQLYFFDREAPVLKSDVDFDTDSLKVKMTTRFSVGWSDWRGVVGSQGA